MGFRSNFTRKNILIIGCGESGSRTAEKLSKDGHNVYIVDKEQKSLDSLHPSYSGFEINREIVDVKGMQTIAQVKFDIVMVVTEQDNLNIYLSILASKILSIDKVITRLYNDKKANLLDGYNVDIIFPSALALGEINKSLEGM